MLGQPVNYGSQMECRLANPARQHGAVQINACLGQDLALAIERQVVRMSTAE